MRRQFTINGDFAHLKPTGVARYAGEVVAALDRLAAEGHAALDGLELGLVVKDGAPRIPRLAAIEVRRVPDLRGRLPQSWVQLVLPRHVRHGLLSLCNIGPLTVARQILCIHDVHPLQFPASYSRGFRAYNRLVLPRLGQRVARVTTVSAFSRSMLAAHGIAPAGRIEVTYNGHEHVLREPPSRALRARLPRRYVLAIGRDLAYKNTQLAFALAPRLEAAGIDVALVGDFDPGRCLGAAAPPANVHLLGRVDDAELAGLMEGALAFLFPSRVEGFGLPAVEAMALSCPLVVSTSPCLPEICGDAAIAVDPDDVDGWASAIVALARDEGRRAALVAAGRRLLERYSWRAIALQYAALMQAMPAR